MDRPRYRRILLKLSGEALGENGEQFSSPRCKQLVAGLVHLVREGIQVAVVVGGGNILRGTTMRTFGFPQVPGDQLGMLATALNGLFLQELLRKEGIAASVMSALVCAPFLSLFDSDEAKRRLGMGEVLLFVGGTGHPYFTTDTAAALRALEVEAEVLLKATKVSGIFSSDPVKDPEARRYEQLTYDEVLAKHLQVMDSTAIALCREQKLPIYVFDLFQENALWDAVTAQRAGTTVVG